MDLFAEQRGCFLLTEIPVREPCADVPVVPAVRATGDQRLLYLRERAVGAVDIGLFDVGRDPVVDGAGGFGDGDREVLDIEDVVAVRVWRPGVALVDADPAAVREPCPVLRGPLHVGGAGGVTSDPLRRGGDVGHIRVCGVDHVAHLALLRAGWGMQHRPQEGFSTWPATAKRRRHS